MRGLLKEITETELNLDRIKHKLMHVESGEGWSQQKADAVELEYRRFLCLMKMYPNETLAPQVDVDTFWHYHILDTMKYAKDCERAFGYFLHHYPYVGMGDGEQDAQVRLDSGERTRILYEASFGEACVDCAAERATPAAYCAGPEAAVKAQAAFCGGAKAAIKNRTAYCAGPEAPIELRTPSCAAPEAAVRAC
ncbi:MULTISPECIES: glycine-rich domain-containing protein-like [unclassified Massilia]|uniref:glycine-rich domain-containing protein n=1 Tax=unclassified Massilia TaxID=2609279 RepID=UPI000D687842|nr:MULTISPECIES: glycine-rich domain-containing protein-like [unclassified Massilia]